MAAAIDAEMMAWMLVNNGWVSVVVDLWTEVAELDQWCDEFVKGNRMRASNIWIFEDKEDATLFALKWA